MPIRAMLGAHGSDLVRLFSDFGQYSHMHVNPSNHYPPLLLFLQKHLSQKMMRARVVAQGFTIAVLAIGAWVRVVVVVLFGVW